MSQTTQKNRKPVTEAGYYVNKLREGYFEQTFENGDRFFGNFKQDIRIGEWKEIYSSGNQFQGHFKDGLEDGEWKCKFGDGSESFGHYRGGVQQGQWVLKYVNGNILSGQITNNIKNGRWIMQCNGEDYYTDFEDGKCDLYYSKSGFVGKFVKGMRNGLWLFEPKYGLQHTINFENDVKDGPFTELIDGEFHQCLYEKGQTVREAKNLGVCTLVNTKNEQGFLNGSTRVGFWKLLGDPFYDAQQKELQNFEFGEYVNGVKDGLWISVTYKQSNARSIDRFTFKNGIQQSVDEQIVSQESFTNQQQRELLNIQ